MSSRVIKIGRRGKNIVLLLFSLFSLVGGRRQEVVSLCKLHMLWLWMLLFVASTVLKIFGGELTPFYLTLVDNVDAMLHGETVKWMRFIQPHLFYLVTE